MKSLHPVKKLIASLQLPPKFKSASKAPARSIIISREESLNRIFMARYRMGNIY
jgi:hypothetical protein